MESRMDLEAAAEAVHNAYLTTCAKLGWAVKPSNQVPYAELSEDSKELDRASVRAVVEYLASIPARSAPEPAPGEGSPSHPSSPSQDSQEAALSQSPKGAPKPPPIKDEDYPHSLDDCIRRMEFLAIEGIADGSRPRIGGLCLSVAEHLERLKRLESPKGAAGAGQLREMFMRGMRLANPEFLERCDLEALFRIELEGLGEPSAPKGAAGPDRALAMETLLVLACKELIRRTGSIESQGCRSWWQGKEEGLEGGGDGEPSAPKTGLRGAGAPGDPAKQSCPRCGSGLIRNGERIDCINHSCGFWVRMLAPGDVGEAGGVDHG